jgi:glucose-1-phosphate cytidylyltransferase
MLESESITVVILAGGLGSRLREETEFRPKTLLPINETPILSHIIEIYANQGFKDFVICAGYLGSSIHEYFSKNGSKSNTKNEVNENSSVYTFRSPIYSNLVNVRVVNTGVDTLAGGRLFRVREYLTGNTFACTYGDGVGNVDIQKLLACHTKNNLLGTVTAVKPPSRFGILEINEENLITGFMEKPESFWVSGGFFLFQKEILNLMHENINLEHTLLPKLALAGDLNAYHHRGFWHPMDTYRDFETLNELASQKKTPPWFAEITKNTSDD